MTKFSKNCKKTFHYFRTKIFFSRKSTSTSTKVVTVFIFTKLLITEIKVSTIKTCTSSLSVLLLYILIQIKHNPTIVLKQLLMQHQDGTAQLRFFDPQLKSKREILKILSADVTLQALIQAKTMWLLDPSFFHENYKGLF